MGIAILLKSAKTKDLTKNKLKNEHLHNLSVIDHVV